MTKKIIHKSAQVDRWTLDGMTMTELAATVQGWVVEHGPEAKIDLSVGDGYLEITIDSHRVETDEEYAARLELEALILVRQQEAKERGERAMLAQLKAKYG